MYLRSASRKWVLTGDVIKDLLLPNLKSEDFQLISSGEDSPNYSVRKYLSSKFFVFMSHECDFNEDKRNYFLLAPLINIGNNIRRSTEEYDKFKNSNDVINHPHYLNYFYYENHKILETDMCVDFTRMLFFPATRKHELVRNKCIQLTVNFRRLLKDKIGYYFSHEH